MHLKCFLRIDRDGNGKKHQKELQQHNDTSGFLKNKILTPPITDLYEGKRLVADVSKQFICFTLYT